MLGKYGYTYASKRQRQRIHTHTHTHTHTEKYVILIAFPRQQWFHERASVLRYTYIACLVWYFKSVQANAEIHSEDRPRTLPSTSYQLTKRRD
jgi:hypothetical protein